MSIKALALAVAIPLGLTLPGMVQADMIIEDAYARASTPTAQSGAAFMLITNQSDTDDRVVSASSDAAQRVELHTHLEDANGVMRMMEVEDGFAIPAGETHMLARGGDHVMFMGLTAPFTHGEEIEVTLTFERADPLTVMIPVDLDRQDHGTMDHSEHGTDG